MDVLLLLCSASEQLFEEEYDLDIFLVSILSVVALGEGHGRL